MCVPRRPKPFPKNMLHCVASSCWTWVNTTRLYTLNNGRLICVVESSLLHCTRGSFSRHPFAHVLWRQCCWLYERVLTLLRWLFSFHVLISYARSNLFASCFVLRSVVVMILVFLVVSLHWCVAPNRREIGRNFPQRIQIVTYIGSLADEQLLTKVDMKNLRLQWMLVEKHSRTAQMQCMSSLRPLWSWQILRSTRFHSSWCEWRGQI